MYPDCTRHAFDEGVLASGLQLATVSMEKFPTLLLYIFGILLNFFGTGVIDNGNDNDTKEAFDPGLMV